MGIHGIARPPGPKPKATCPRCGRPVAVLKSGKCSYCGEEFQGAASPVEAKAALPPDLLLALEPRPARASGGSKWFRRTIAFGVMAVLLAAFMGSCMKT